MSKLLPRFAALLGTVCLAAGCTSEVTEDPVAPTETPTPAATPPPADVDPAIAAIRDFIDTIGVDTNRSGWKTSLQRPPQQTFTPGKSYYWNMVTSEGPIKIRLMPDVAPMHVTSTIYLTEMGFYDNLKFHRVINGFMAQGGCPLGTGTGNPGYSYAGEFSPSVRHNRPGLLSMANAGPNTDGSQFFLTFVPTPHLDDKHTIFGEVVDGMATVRSLEASGSRSGQTSKPLSIQSATITVE